MSDHIDRAAEIIHAQVHYDTPPEVLSCVVCRDAVDSLKGHGALVTPAHDAAVAAKAWREGFTTGQSRAMRHMSDEPLLPLSAPNPYERQEEEKADG